MTPSFQPLDDGVYEFELTVSDGEVSASDRVRVTVENGAPVSNDDLAVSSTLGVTMVAGTFRDLGILDTHTATVDWGDGTPPEQVGVLAQGTGWGELQASHVYTVDGSYTVSVTVVDDDGDAAETRSTMVVVSDAGAPATNLGVALWANSSTAKQTIQVSGSGQRIVGLTHSNNELKVTGSNKVFTGGTEYATKIQTSGSGNTFSPSPVQTPPSGFPKVFPIADYQPGGRAAVAAGAAFFDMSSACGSKWQPSGVLAPGLYWVPCDVGISGRQFTAGPVTIAAGGDIHVSGSGQDFFEPFIDGVLFTSADTTDSAIKVSGSNSDFVGYMFAGAGGIDISGSNHELSCGLLADRIKITGSGTRVDVDSCPVGESEIIDADTTAVPLTVPRLDLAFVGDNPAPLPGQAITYQATASNAATTLVVPGVVAAQNLEAAGPVTVDAARFWVEYHDLATGSWVTLASTDDDTARFATQPTAQPGATYPAPGDRITGTTVGPLGWGIWAAAGAVDLTPTQLALLRDPAAVDAVRARVEVVTGPGDAAVRQVVGFGDNLAPHLAAADASLTDGRVTITRPGGAPVFATPADTADLAVLAPGASATVTATSPVATAAPKDVAESNSAYIARLAALDETAVVASGFATATSTLGPIAAPQRVSIARVGLPVLEMAVTAPEVIDSGGTATWTITLTNTGSRPATSYTPSLRVDGTPVALDGATPQLAPGESVTLTANVAVPATRSASYTADAEVEWADAAANTYGPLTESTHTEVMTPPGLRVTKSTDRGPELDDHPDQLRYQIQVTNTGSSPLTDVALADTPDPNTAIVTGSLTTTAGTITSGADPGDTTITIDIGTLAAGETVLVDYLITAAHAPAAVVTITNQATVTTAELPPVLSDDPTRPGIIDPTVRPVPGRPGSGGGGPGGTNTGPTLGVCTPAEGATLTTPTALSCELEPRAGTTVENWAVSIRPTGAPPTDAQVLATGTGPAVTAGLDPTLMDNGIWTITITATDDDEGISTHETSVVVDGQLKLGRYRVTYQDLAVPVGGIPIGVQRTYDTLDRNQRGDFGHGWTLDVADFKAQANRPLGEGGWERYACGSGFIFVPLCYRTTRPHYVTVTWPDGRTETFDFTPRGLNTFFPIGAIPAYTPRPGVTSRLEPAPGDDAAGSPNPTDGNIYNGGFADGDIYNPTRFTLTARNGTRYLLDTTTGLVEAEDRNNNTITIDPDGIHSSLGPDITFTRNPDGLITTVTGPDGAALHYTYTPDGDLDTVTNQLDRTTSFTYENHALVAVDPAGGTGPWRSMDYDPAGRLAGITDASGNRTPVTVDVAARTEVVTAADGRLSTVSAFDERGNITSVARAHDGAVRTTHFEYDGDRVSARIDPEGNRWSATYDTVGNPTGFVEPDGDGATMTYDSYGALLSWTDGLGRTTYYDYDEGGLLRTVVLADGGVVSYGYDSGGRMTSRSHPVEGTTSWTYSPEGWLRTETTGDATTMWTYDEAGRVVTETGPEGSRSWGYDAVGNVVTATDADGIHHWAYDAGDRVVEASSSGGTEHRVYDQVGRLVASTGPAGAYSWGWDTTGNLLSEAGPDATTTRTFDGAGRALTETTGDRTVTWTWDDRDRPETMTRPDGNVVALSWGADGRIAGVADPTAGDHTFEWDAAGHLASRTSPAGTRTYDWDIEGHPLGGTDTAPDAGALAEPAGFATGPEDAAQGATVALAPAPTAYSTPVPSPLLTPPGPTGPTPPAPLPRPPGPAQPDNNRGGGGVLAEYAWLIQWAISNAPALAALGTETAAAVTAVAATLTTQTAAPHTPPVPAPTPPPIPNPVPTPTPDPADDDPPPPPLPPDDCPATPSGSDPDRDYTYEPGDPYPDWTGQPVNGDIGSTAATGALADLRAPLTPNTDQIGDSILAPGDPGPNIRDARGIDRGHLIARVLGGQSKDVPGNDRGSRNLIAQFLQANRGPMRTAENTVREAVEGDCQQVLYEVKPVYRAGTPPVADLAEDQLPVESVEITAVSDGGFLFVPPVLSIPNAR